MRICGAFVVWWETDTQWEYLNHTINWVVFNVLKSIQTRRYTKMKKIYRIIVNRWLHSMNAMNPSLEGKTVLYWRIRWENLWENLIVDRPFAKKNQSLLCFIYASSSNEAVHKNRWRCWSKCLLLILLLLFLLLLSSLIAGMIGVWAGHEAILLFPALHLKLAIND